MERPACCGYTRGCLLECPASVGVVLCPGGIGDDHVVRGVEPRVGLIERLLFNEH